MRRWGALLLFVAVPLLAACNDDDDSATPRVLFPDRSADADGGEPEDRVLDDTALEGPDGVQSILIDHYKMTDVESVSCPADQEVRQGNKFQCKVKVGGEDPKELTVEITITDNEGQYQVALPEEAK